MPTTAPGSDGVLPTTTGDLYTAVGEERIVAMTFMNANVSTARVINLFINRTGTDRPILLTESLPLKTSFNDLRAHTLQAGDTIRGDVDAGSDTHYLISIVRLA